MKIRKVLGLLLALIMLLSLTIPMAGALNVGDTGYYYCMTWFAGKTVQKSSGAYTCGNGFDSESCFICSWAMVLSNAYGRQITPSDVIAKNSNRVAVSNPQALASSFNASYNSYQLSGVPDAKAAVLYNALKQHPEGLLVHSSRSHMIVAVTTNAAGEVLFNDSGISNAKGRRLKDCYHFSWDNADWYATLSVNNPQPASPPTGCWVKSSSLKTNSTTPMNFTWGANNATSYHLDIWKNGSHQETKYLGNVNSYSLQLPEGNYSVYITPFNAAGEGSNAHVDFVVSDITTSANIPNGTYRLVSMLERTMCISLDDGEVTNNLNAVLKSNYSSDRQRFTLERQADNTYLIKYDDTYALDVAYGSRNANVALWPYGQNGDSNRKFYIVDCGNDFYQFIHAGNGQALRAASDSPGANISVGDNDGSDNTKFFLAKVVTGVSIEKKTLAMEEGEKKKLKVDVTPNDAWDRDVSWNSSDPSIAVAGPYDIDTGSITAKSPGKCTITATTSDGRYTATCEITVKEKPTTIAVTSVGLDKSVATIQKGKSTTLTATVKPSNATNKKVTWSSSDTSVATVDVNGTVIGVKAGTATITAKAGGKSASCKVTVKNSTVPVSSVNLNKSTVSLQKGESTALTATVSPSNATDKTVVWKSSNTEVATVSSTGKVTAKAAGTATITATAGNRSASCKVTVKNSSSNTHGVSCPSASYADVNKDSGHWTHLPIDYVLQKGYMQGVSEGEFAPNGTVTRAQIVQMLYAKEGKPAVSGARKFRDVAGGKWYANAVEWASTKGVVAGYSDGTFKPEQAVTREQLVTIMYAYARYQGKDLTPSGRLSGFSDAESVSSYAKTPIRWAIGKKIISGMGSGLEPQGRSTRAQIAVILKAYDQNVK